MRTKRIIIGVAIVIAIACIILIISLLGVGKTSNNEATFVGNTGGNLNNSGLFCEYDGKVYFSNPDDNGSLYSMNPDETNLKKISGTSVQSLNVDDNRIYYTLSGNSSGAGLGYVRKATGLYSVKHNGSSVIAYTQDPVGIATLVGNNIYYQHFKEGVGTNVDKIGTDRSNNTKVIDKMVSPASSNGGVIYYSGADKDMYLYTYDINSGMSNVIYERNMYNPVFINGDIFYIDLDTRYQLHRYNISSGTDYTLTDERVEMFNVMGTYIYYQTSSALDNPALKCMSVDGTGIQTVADGIYCDINMTSNYVYFHSYDSLFPMYHVPYGSTNASLFSPGTKK